MKVVPSETVNNIRAGNWTTKVVMERPTGNRFYVLKGAKEDSYVVRELNSDVSRQVSIYQLASEYNRFMVEIFPL